MFGPVTLAIFYVLAFALGWFGRAYLSRAKPDELARIDALSGRAGDAANAAGDAAKTEYGKLTQKP